VAFAAIVGAWPKARLNKKSAHAPGMNQEHVQRISAGNNATNVQPEGDANVSTQRK
jgi:hypothetical protein